MSHSSIIPKAASPELTALCQAQITLLTQILKADWGAVYLTQSIAGDTQTNLIPIVIYPQTNSFFEELEHFRELKAGEDSYNLSDSFLLAEKSSQSEIDVLHSLWDEKESQETNRLILPLIYEEQMRGLLVTERKKRQWNSQELAQIEKIAQTLAIACLWEQKQQWYEQKLQEQQLRQTLEREHIDNFLHQLRNPLTALKTFGKLLLKRFFSDERDQNAIRGILRESDRLQDLMAEFEAEMNDRGDFALEGKKLPALPPAPALVLESVIIVDILEPLLLSATAIAQEKKITLTSHYSANLPPVQANAKALREVLSNLLDNALKYTPSEGQVTVTVELNTVQNQVGIFISDTGYGIPIEDQEHLFERHYRGVQSQGSIPGTGLGLAIAKELIEQMQGRIELISPNPNSQKAFPGTVFIVWLPVVSQDWI